MALFDDGGVACIDWQMVLRAPVAVELGWFLVANSSALALPPDAVLERYFAAAAAFDPRALGDIEAQRDLTWIVGLLLRGWRKGLDADASHRLASGVAATDDLAWWCERALDAASRRLEQGGRRHGRALPRPTQLGAARSRRGKTIIA